MKLTELDAYRDKIINIKSDKDAVTIDVAPITKQVALTNSEINLIKEFCEHKAAIMRKNLAHLKQQVKSTPTANQMLAMSHFSFELKMYQTIINKLTDDEIKD